MAARGSDPQRKRTVPVSHSRSGLWTTNAIHREATHFVSYFLLALGRIFSACSATGTASPRQWEAVRSPHRSPRPGNRALDGCLSWDWKYPEGIEMAPFLCVPPYPGRLEIEPRMPTRNTMRTHAYPEAKSSQGDHSHAGLRCTQGNAWHRLASTLFSSEARILAATVQFFVSNRWNCAQARAERGSCTPSDRNTSKESIGTANGRTAVVSDMNCAWFQMGHA